MKAFERTIRVKFIKIEKMIVWKDLQRGAIILLIGMLIACVFRIFFFKTFSIPSKSMYPTLDAGDYIFVNKLIPGPRILINLLGINGESRRLNGYRSIRRNDVLVFNRFNPSNPEPLIQSSLFYAKRCMALPGDTIFIENGIYRVSGVLDVLGSNINQKMLSNISESRLREIPGIFNSFPNSKKEANWNIKNFGPLYVPKKGDTILINKFTISLYKKLIEYESGQEVIDKDGEIYLDIDKLTSYIFQQNYYFMAGDNVLDSNDSRYWGPLPESHILGKVELILTSKDDNGKYRFNRFFKFLD